MWMGGGAAGLRPTKLLGELVLSSVPVNSPDVWAVSSFGLALFRLDKVCCA